MTEFSSSPWHGVGNIPNDIDTVFGKLRLCTWVDKQKKKENRIMRRALVFLFEQAQVY